MDASTMIAMKRGKGRTQFRVVRKTPFDVSGKLKLGACRAVKLETPLTTIRYQLDMNVFIKCISQQGNYAFSPYFELPSVILTIITGPLNLTHADTLARTSAYAVRFAAKEQASKLAAAKLLREKADAEVLQKRNL